jgi:hypothetical protein
MKNHIKSITEVEIQEAYQRLNEAILQLLRDFEEDLPGNGPWWLDPQSTVADVLSYTARYGRDHLDELVTGLSHDQNLTKFACAEVLYDINGATGLNGMLLVLLGLAEALIVVDHCSAAGVVALQLAELLDIDCTYRDITSFPEPTSFVFPHKSIFLLASHAQNVLYFNAEADAALETQNQKLLQTLQESFPNIATLSAVSLEPARGVRGLNNLLNAWQGNLCMQDYCQVPVAKFGRGLRLGHKRYESGIHTNALVKA